MTRMGELPSSSKTDGQALLNNSFAPITSEIGFLRCEAAVAAEAFVAWQEHIQRERGVQLMAAVQRGDLRDKIRVLLPLTSVERRRFLFAPVAGGWTAYFDNGWRGGDPASVVSYLAEKIGCRGVRVGAVHHEGAQKGSVILEIYSPARTDFVNTERSIALVHDGSRWTFSATGVVQPFEEPEKYKVARVRERFTLDMLARYLKQMEIDAFNEASYGEGPAYCVTKFGPAAKGLKEYALSDARTALGLL